MKIEDGRGSGLFASVSGVQRLNVSAKTAPRIFYISRDDERAFNWTSSYSASTGDEIIYLKNTDTDRNLIIHQVDVGGVNTGLFEIYQVTGTATGTEINGTNLKLASGRTPDALSYGDAAVGGLTLGNRISLLRTDANSSRAVGDIAECLFLGFNDAIAIQYTGSAGIVDCSITGYLEDSGKR